MSAKTSKFKKFWQGLYEKLIKIDDTPHKVSLGFGLGVFAGIMPAMGPVISIFLAFIFRANRASAIAASLITNTWLSFVTLLAAIKIGALVLGENWKDVQQNAALFIKEFRWIELVQLRFLKMVFPVILGYIIVAIFFGIIAYIIALFLIMGIKKRKELVKRKE